jgi:hypothetical protein
MTTTPTGIPGGSGRKPAILLNGMTIDRGIVLLRRPRTLLMERQASALALRKRYLVQDNGNRLDVRADKYPIHVSRTALTEI